MKLVFDASAGSGREEWEGYDLDFCIEPLQPNPYQGQAAVPSSADDDMVALTPYETKQTEVK